MYTLYYSNTCEITGRRDEEPEQWQSWQSDVTDSMGIGPSLSGYKHVSLHCGADHMLVELEMEENFDGVIYTRGAFHGREAPCFLDAAGGHNFTLRLPFTSCNTRKVVRSLTREYPAPQRLSTLTLIQESAMQRDTA